MIIFTCLLFFIFPLSGNQVPEVDQSMKIVSGEVAYQKNEMTLLGNVCIEHPIGIISAKRLSMQCGEKDQQKCQFSSLKIAEDIHIQFASGGTLSCQEANMDYGKRKGFFYGNEKYPDVTFQGIEENKSVPFEVKAKQMALELFAEKTELQSISAENDIRILYDQDCRLFADHALYLRISDPDADSVHESIALSMQEEQAFCQMETKSNDRLYAKEIQIDLNYQHVSFTHLHGSVQPIHSEKEEVKLEYSALTAIWDQTKENFELRGNVSVSQNGILFIETNDSLFIQQRMLDGKRCIESIYAPKNVQITYLRKEENNDQKTMHTIHCPGFFSIQQQAQEIVLHRAPEGVDAPHGGQVFIEDEAGEVYADCMRILYTKENEQICPKKMILEGNVKLFNRFDGHWQESSSVLHYALADRVEYLPKEQKMILSGTKENRVLFFDKVNNIQMSSPSLLVKQDKQTKKNLVQGMGDVRFTFIEKEFEQLKTRFRL